MRHAGGGLGAPELNGDNGDVTCAGFLKAVDEAFRITHSLDEQPDHLGLGHFNGKIQVVGGGDGQFLAGRDHEAVLKAFVTVAHDCEGRARVGNQRDVAGPMVVAGFEAADPHLVGEIVEPHAVAAT